MEMETHPLDNYHGGKFPDFHKQGKGKGKKKSRKERKKVKKLEKMLQIEMSKSKKRKIRLKAEQLANTERERRYQAEADRKILAALLRISCSVTGVQFPPLPELPEPHLEYLGGGAADS